MGRRARGSSASQRRESARRPSAGCAALCSPAAGRAAGADSVAVNIRGRVFARTPVFSRADGVPRRGVARSRGDSARSVLRSFRFSRLPAARPQLAWFVHHSGVGGISLWCFFAFPWWLTMLSVSSCASGHLCFSFGEMPVLRPLPFLIGLFVFLLLSRKSSSCISDVSPLSDAWFANIFSYSGGCLLTVLIPS